MIRKAWREVRRVIYIRCREMGSVEVWFWLARIIRGRSQQVRTSRGVDRGSRAIIVFKLDHPVSPALFSQVRLKTAIIKLWARAVGHSR